MTLSLLRTSLVVTDERSALRSAAAMTYFSKRSASPIVVGTVDTTEARAAVRWAAFYALRGGHPLVLVHADPSIRHGTHVGASREAFLASTGDALCVQFPGLVVETRVVSGFAPYELVNASSTAAMVVVGRAAEPDTAHLRNGSVTSALVSRSACPVAVIRPIAPGPGRPVVVVTDPLSPMMLFGTAFREAAVLGTSVSVLDAPLVAPGRREAVAGSIYGRTTIDVQDATTRLIAWRDMYPTVDVELVEPPTDMDSRAALLARSASAALVVVEGGRDRDDLYGRCPYILAEYAVLHCATDILVVPTLEVS